MSERLCYVDPPWAWFTTAPLTEQWGDDWNDAPYEHNAGDPYEWLPYMEKHGRDPYVLTRVAWSGGGDLETPGELCAPNSPYSVQAINEGAVAWLTDPAYGERPRVYRSIIWAGVTLSDFVEIIEGRGGTVYLPAAANAREKATA